MKASHRLLHGFAVVAVALAMLLGGAVVAVSLNVSNSVPWETPHRNILWFAAVGLGLLLCLTIVAIVRRVAWGWIVLASMLPAALFVFLAHDEGPFELPDLGPRVGSDDPGYRAIMWFGKGSPYSRLDELDGMESKPIDDELRLPQDPALWVDYVLSRKDSIERAWSDLSLCLEWAERLAENPPLGVWHHRVGDPLLEFRAIRRLVFVANAHAYLLAVENEPDLGLRTLIPVIRAMHNLQRTGPLLLNGMVAASSLQATLLNAQAILIQRGVSNGVRAELREALESAPPIASVMHNIFGGEIEYAASVLDQFEAESAAAPGISTDIDPWIGTGISLAGRLVFNRNRTLRVVTSTMEGAEALAVARKFDGLEEWRPPGTRWSQQLRNPVGRLLDVMIIAAPAKGIRRIWEDEDLRLTLLRQLGQT